jgi:hypothetical protein
MILHLGVVDVAYTGEDGATTTGDVAGYLEDDYHIMEVFAEVYGDFISDELANQMKGVIESILQGGYSGSLNNEVITKLGNRNISGQGFGGKIEEKFRDFIDAGEMQRILPPTQPIKAAEAGVRHRFKSPYSKKNKSRVAFKDTGLYSQSMRAWLDASNQ